MPGDARSGTGLKVDDSNQESVCQSRLSGLVCSVCEKNYYQYVCPRCNILYCSLSCYKSERHLSCSERFYEQEFCQALKGMRISRDGRQKMAEIVKRADGEHYEDSDTTVDTEDEEHLCKALRDLGAGSDPEAVLSTLSSRQQVEFNAIILGTKECISLIEMGKPWWIEEPLEYLERGELKLPNHSAARGDEFALSAHADPGCPQDRISAYAKRKAEELESNTPNFFPESTLEHGDFTLLLNNVVDVVSSYVYCHMFVSTEFVLALREATEILQSLSSILRPNSQTRYLTPLKAWQGFVDNLSVFEERVVPPENISSILANVITVLSSKVKVLRALKDIWGLYWAVSKTLGRKKPEISCFVALAMKIRYYYGLYRDYGDTTKWAVAACDVLKIKQIEVAEKKLNAN